MDIRALTETFHVSPQISSEEAATLRPSDYALVICNRPDEEVPPALQADAIGEAVRAAGIAFAELPLRHQAMTAETIIALDQLVESADGPVLAYCASGTRSSVLWALWQAQEMGAEAVIKSAADAGYNIAGLRPTLKAVAAV